MHTYVYIYVCLLACRPVFRMWKCVTKLHPYPCTRGCRKPWAYGSLLSEGLATTWGFLHLEGRQWGPSCGAALNSKSSLFSKVLYARQRPPPHVVWPEARVQKRLPDKLASVAPLAMRSACAQGSACSFLPCRGLVTTGRSLRVTLNGVFRPRILFDSLIIHSPLAGL